MKNEPFSKENQPRHRSEGTKLVFRYSDVAEAKGVSKHAVYKAIQDNRLDVNNLKSIAEYIAAGRTRMHTGGVV